MYTFFLNPLRLLWINPTPYLTWTCNFCVCGIQEDVLNKNRKGANLFFLQKNNTIHFRQQTLIFFLSHIHDVSTYSKLTILLELMHISQYGVCEFVKLTFELTNFYLFCLLSSLRIPKIKSNFYYLIGLVFSIEPILLNIISPNIFHVYL